MARTLLGTIAEKDGFICLQTSPGCWYPLGGNSGIAEDFRESFNAPAPSDVGRQLWRVGGVLQMESIAQRDERLLREASAGFTCRACKREEADCSAEPCAAVIADREA